MPTACLPTWETNEAASQLPCHITLSPVAQAEQAWERARYHVVPRPHLLLPAAAAARGAATFSCSLASAALAFLADHQLCGAPFLPLGALLEAAAAVAATCLGDSDAPNPQLLLTSVAVPALIELPVDAPAAEVPRLVCSLSARTGQLVAAGSSAAGQRHCFTAQLARSAETADGRSLQPGVAKVRGLGACCRCCVPATC